MTREKITLSQIESLWNKYAVSFRSLEARRAETLEKLDGFLGKLGYLK